MVPTPPSSEKIPMRRDNNIAEAEKMGIIFMFFGEQISNIGIPWEVGDKDFGKTVSVAHSHVADINMPHLFVSTVVGPVHSTSVVIPKRGGESDIRHVEVTKDMADELGNLGALICRFDFRFAGTAAHTMFTNGMPGYGATCTCTDGTKKGATLFKRDDVGGVGFGSILGAPVGIGVSGESGSVLGPTKGGGEV